LPAVLMEEVFFDQGLLIIAYLVNQVIVMSRLWKPM
jgi:hypothetical protein